MNGGRPLIGVTIGDPAGVGPEVVVRALNDSRVRSAVCPVAIGSRKVLQAAAAVCGTRLDARAATLDEWRAGAPAGPATVVDCGDLPEPLRPGAVGAATGAASARYVEIAVAEARAGRVRAVATAPIHKEAWKRAGIPHLGHTEMLSALTGARRVCMMLASDTLKVSLVTAHAALADVPARITRERVEDTIRLTAAMLRAIGLDAPRIAVCALNPHGGENGLFGNEEQTLLRPAIRAVQRDGSMRIEGPLAPDTAFLEERRSRVDAYVVMYHDQGLIPFKMLAFETGVNITLGLPIVRTSVDHGTAFDKAWQGTASAESLVQSILWAARLSAGTGVAGIPADGG